MFSTSGLFKNTPCPAGPDKCKLTNCLFSHERKAVLASSRENAGPVTAVSTGDEHGDLKRRKLSDAPMQRIRATSKEEKTPTKQQATARVPVSILTNARTQGERAPRVPMLSTRPISPPPVAQGNKKLVSATKPASSGASSAMNKAPEKKETLNPRLVPRNSTPHATRSLLLKKLHAEFVRLNNEVGKSKDNKISSLKLSDNELIRMALDQEEEIVKKQPGVYPQIMKNKLHRYMKMPLKDWSTERQNVVDDAAAAANGVGQTKSASDRPIKIETGLSHSEELQMLERYILSPKQMSQAGFILCPPTEAQIVDAQKTIEASGGYETCDRCGTRFQLLEEPREGGSYTTNGKCVHHWGKPVFPKREKTDYITGPKEALYFCCNQPKGSPGCSTMESHVFKIGAANVGRLASILQFETTPLNTKAERIAIAFDCEMGYTTAGLEIIRLSACKWPSNEALIDVLVQPVGKILDLNTKFSGVTPRQFNDAIEYDPEKHKPLPEIIKSKGGTDTTQTQELKIMSSPAAARSLLTQYISPTTVLIGHAIDNDLNVLRLLHPTIVDTSLLFPHHAGLPYRFPLRKLAKDFLNLDIQTAGAAGHDSMEDSRATGDLVRFKVMNDWAKFKDQGWSVKDGKFYATIGREQKLASLPPYKEGQGWSKKRKAEEDAAKMGQIGESAGLRELLGEKSETSKL